MLASKKIQAENARLKNENARLTARNESQQKQIQVLLYQLITIKDELSKQGIEVNIGD